MIKNRKLVYLYLIFWNKSIAHIKAIIALVIEDAHNLSVKKVNATINNPKTVNEEV